VEEEQRNNPALHDDIHVTEFRLLQNGDFQILNCNIEDGCQLNDLINNSEPCSQVATQFCFLLSFSEMLQSGKVLTARGVMTA